MKISLFLLTTICLHFSGYFTQGDGLPAARNVRLESFKRDGNGDVDCADDCVESGGLPEGRRLLEGDIIPDEDDEFEEVRAMRLDGGAELSKRKAVKKASKRWPNDEVPYYVDSDVESYYGSDIDTVVALYEANTCLDFIKHTSAPTGGYIHVKSGTGCSSHIGYKSSARNLVLQLGGCLSKIAHEFGHALGFRHEHVRPDRDTYVTVRTENIETGATGHFSIGTTQYIETFSIPYDYASVMHYDPLAFSANDEPTLVTIDPMDMVDMGVNDYPDFLDYRTLNQMYECNDGCSSITCENEGYQDSSCSCVCPPGWTGTTCTTAVTLPDDCKNTITGGSGQVTSTNYPSNYPSDHTCQWLIKGTAAGQTITVTFVDFDLEPQVSGYCWFDYLEIRTTDLYYGGDRFCGTTLPSTQSVTSSTEPPEMLLFFSSNTNANVDTGFKLNYSIS